MIGHRAPVVGRLLLHRITAAGGLLDGLAFAEVVGIVLRIARTHGEGVGRIRRVQVLLAEIDVLQRVLPAGTAAGLADGVGGKCAGCEQRGTRNREYQSHQSYFSWLVPHGLAPHDLGSSWSLPEEPRTNCLFCLPSSLPRACTRWVTTRRAPEWSPGHAVRQRQIVSGRVIGRPARCRDLQHAHVVDRLLLGVEVRVGPYGGLNWVSPMSLV